MLGGQMIEKLYDFHWRANERLLQLAEKLSKEQWQAQSDVNKRSLQSTLTHILMTDWLWRNVYLGTFRPGEWPSLSRRPSPVDLREFMHAQMEETRPVLDSMTDERLAEQVEVIHPSGQVYTLHRWHMLMQPLLHGMQHRSEIAAILTASGHSPGDMDFIYFV